MDWSEETASIVDAEPIGDPVGDLSGRVIGDFAVGELIGRGGNGVVYRAYQRSLDRDVVIKALRRLVSDDPNDRLRDRFLREAQLASGLDHPYAAHIYGFGIEPDGLMWIAMELVRGSGLNQLIKTHGALPVGRLVPLLEKICEVVHTAHLQGIVHRDIKPSNVMVLSRAGQLLPKLLDFGIARRAMEDATRERVETSPDHPLEIQLERSLAAQELDEDMNRSGLLTVATDSESTPRGASLGSPLYMAPEQWEDASRVDAHADQYALGILAFEALTGQLPFRGSSMRMVAAAHTRLPVPSLGPEFPPEMDEVMQRVLAKEPKERYDDVMAFARAMRAAAFLDDERESALPVDRSLVAQYSARAPQPLADAVASLDAALNPQRAIRALAQVIRSCTRFFAVIALSAISRIAPQLDPDEPYMARAIEVVRALHKRQVSTADWIFVLRGLIQPFVEQPDVHPMPELVLLLSNPESVADTSSVLDVLAAFDDEYTAEPTGIRLDMTRAILPEAEKFLQYASFVCDYEMVVTRAGRLESWSGARRAVHPVVALSGPYDPPDGTVLLIGANNEPLLILSPLIQLLEPAPGSPSELFLFDGAGRHGALMTSYPADFQRYDSTSIWPWLDNLPAAFNPSRDTDDDDDGHESELVPYLGLSPFSRADADRFFGREREIEACVNRLRTEPFMAVVGPSGAGKSSFVQAGIASSLPEGWHTVVARPGASPMAAIIQCIKQLGSVDRSLRRRIWRDPDALGTILRKHAATRQQTVVLIIDQFEELVTLCPDVEEQNHYAESLMRATREADDGVRVIITLRDDFLLRVQQITPLSERLGRSLVLLATPPPDQLERIVIEPARRAGYEFDDEALVREMVQDVADEPGALALLSFTASKLWERRDRHFKRLTRRDYEELGGVGGALAQHAESILDAMSDEQKGLVREVFRQLVTAQGTRAILTRRELEQLLGGSDKAEPVLETLIRARLLVASESAASVDTVAGRYASRTDESDLSSIDGADGTDGSGTSGTNDARTREKERRAERDLLEDHVEVVHEALLSSWPRLVEWQREDAENVRMRDQLRVAARQWHERDRPRGLLWRGEALLEYRVWRARYPGAVTRIEDDFSAASLHEDARGRRVKRVLLVSAFAAMLAVIVAVVYFNRNLDQARERAETFAAQAEKHRIEAEFLARESQARLVNMHKEQGRQALLAHQPMRAFVYLREALEGSTALAEQSAHEVESAIRFMLGRAVDALDDQELVIRAQKGNVMDVGISPDGTLIASTGDDGTVKLWDFHTGAQVRELAGHSETGWRLEFNDTGTLLASASWDDTVMMWDPRSGDRLWVGRHEGNVLDLAFSIDGEILATGGLDRTVRVWDPHTGAELRTITEHESGISQVALDRSGRYLASGTRDGIVRIFHVPSGRLVTRTDSLGFVQHLTVSPDGSTLACAGMNGLVYLLPLDGTASSVQPTTLRGHSGVVPRVAFSPDGRLLASAGTDGTARLWDVATGNERDVLDAHPSGLSGLLFSLDGERLLTTGFDGTAKAWSLDRAELSWTFVGHRDAVWRARMGIDGDRFVTGGLDGTVRVWNGVNKTLHVFETKPTAAEVRHAALDPSGTMIATVHGDDSVRIVDRDGRSRHRFAMELQDFTPARVVWHPDGSRLLGSGGTRAVEWDLTTARETRLMDAIGEGVVHAIYSPDGARLISARRDGAIEVRDARTGTLEKSLRGHEGVVQFIDLDAAGTSMVSVGVDRTIRRWNPESSTQTTLVTHRQLPSVVRYSPDGKLIVLLLADKSAELRSAEDGELEVKLEGHDNHVLDAAFSPDGRLVATASDDRSVKIWDVATGTPLWSVDLHHATGRSVEFSADGTLLLGGVSSTARIWRVDYDQRPGTELDHFSDCRIDFTLREGRLGRRELDYRHCFD